ncbi:hypothetical protein Tco_1570300 [Tanacetum coccineum]
MANLEFCDKHNMVAYLQKSEGIEGFHQIVDFLTTSHIRYALTESPTIHVSLIEQFWQTATASTLENGDMEISATIDGKIKVVYEASIRIHLKLEDSDGISALPTTETFEQLALMGGEGSTIPVESHHTPTVAPSTSQPHHSPTLRDLIRQETEVPQPSSPTQTHVADKAASTCMDVRHGGVATTVSSLDAGHGSGNIDKTASMPHDSPLPRVHTLGSDEGRMQHDELMELVTKLTDRVVSLETDLHQTKKVYGAAYTKLIKKVKRLEDKLNKSRRKRRLMGAQTQGSHEHEMEADFKFTTAEDDSTANVSVNTAGAEISTASPKIKTTGVSVDDVAAEGLVYIRRSAAKRKYKGKAIMEESEPTQTKTKIQQEQERLGFEEALRLQEQFDEEERQRISNVHEEGSTFKPEEWDNIQAQIEADEELAHRGYSFDEIKVLFKETLKRVNTFTPMESDDTVPKVVAGSSKRSAEEELEPTEDKERELWVDLKRLFKLVDDDELWKSQRYMHDLLTCRLYDTYGVHHVSTEREHDIFMLVEKDYPLIIGIMTLMMCNKVQVDQHSEMADELLRKIFILVNRPRQSLKRETISSSYSDNDASLIKLNSSIRSELTRGGHTVGSDGIAVSVLSKTMAGNSIRRLDSKTQYAVLIRRFDTSYPIGGYSLSGDQSEQNTI